MIKLPLLSIILLFITSVGSLAKEFKTANFKQTSETIAQTKSVSEETYQDKEHEEWIDLAASSSAGSATKKSTPKTEKGTTSKAPT